MIMIRQQKKNTLQKQYGAQIVYGDTDSCYVHFPTQKTAQDLWDHCLAVEKGIIDVAPLSYIRGRSFSNIFFIIDEAQNLTPHEIKTIISRAGENTKIVFAGDLIIKVICEVIEITLDDQGDAWDTKNIPKHKVV